MRSLILLCLVFFIVLKGKSQDTGVQWSLGIEPLHDRDYRLHLSATVPKGWWVYSAAPADAIDGPSLVSDQDGVHLLGLLKASGSPVAVTDPVFGKPMPVFNHPISWTQDFRMMVPASRLILHLSGFTGNGREFAPAEKVFDIQVPGIVPAASRSFKIAGFDLSSPVADCGDAALVMEAGGAVWMGIFVRGFCGGLVALLMPCIFPMLPLTVSFFLKGAVDRRRGVRNAFLYAGFIVLIYLLAALPFHLMGRVNPQLFNTVSTSVPVNLVFFIVFLLFSLSLLGLFELNLPAGLTNAAGGRSGVNSVAGIFFMALTLVVVSFSCTGPILGALLVHSLQGGDAAWALTAGLGGFGVALALPFGLFALFPQRLQYLPKRGDWMETLKKCLGILELGLAFKFLSNADTVQHWGLLKREVFIGIWVLLLLSMAALLLLRRRVSWGRLGFGLLALLGAGYLVPGLLKGHDGGVSLISGFAPPANYSIYPVMPGRVEPDVINDYEKAVALARSAQKPLLVDFTGWACVNCRKMEEQVWNHPAVAGLMRDQFILVSLYVDDRKKLPADLQFDYHDAGGMVRSIRTVGDQWSTFQAENFGAVSQPQYAILSPDGTLMNRPVGFSSVAEYSEWLSCGLKAYRDKPFTF